MPVPEIAAARRWRLETRVELDVETSQADNGGTLRQTAGLSWRATYLLEPEAQLFERARFVADRADGVRAVGPNAAWVPYLRWAGGGESSASARGDYKWSKGPEYLGWTTSGSGDNAVPLVMSDNPGGPQTTGADGKLVPGTGQLAFAGPEIPIKTGAYFAVDPDTGRYEVGFNGLSVKTSRTDSGMVRNERKKGRPLEATRPITWEWELDLGWVNTFVAKKHLWEHTAPFADGGGAQFRLVLWDDMLVALRGTVPRGGGRGFDGVSKTGGLTVRWNLTPEDPMTFEPESIRLRLFIPSPAVWIPGHPNSWPPLRSAREMDKFTPPKEHDPVDVLVAGDDRQFSYDKGTHRFQAHHEVTCDPDATKPVVAEEVEFGKTHTWLRAPGAKAMSGKPWWWFKRPRTESVETQLAVTKKTAYVKVESLKKEGVPNAVRLTYTVRASIPAADVLIKATAPKIDADLVVEVGQGYDGTLYYRVLGAHDGFPSYELYLRKQRVHGHGADRDYGPLALLPPAEVEVAIPSEAVPATDDAPRSWATLD